MPRRLADRFRIAALALALAAPASGCGNTPTTQQCEALLDHVVDIEAREVGGNNELPAAMKADLDRQRKELAAQMRDGFVEHCIERLPASFVACGLEARTKADYAECEKQP